MAICQKILCSVKSCVHHSKNKNDCELGEIQVSPTINVTTGVPTDETLCSSYLIEENKK